MQITIKFILLLSFLIIFQPAQGQKKTTLEAFSGISISNGTRLIDQGGSKSGYSYTLKYRFGTKLYTSLGKNLNLGLGVNYFNIGYGYDSTISIPREFQGPSGEIFPFESRESSRFYESFWHIGIPLALNIQIKKASKKNETASYFEVGITPAFTQFSRSQNIHPEITEIQIDKNSSSWNNLLLLNTAFVMQHNITDKLSIIVRPSFQVNLLDRTVQLEGFENHHDFNVELGLRRRL